MQTGAVCGGDNSTCIDCAGELHGPGVVDQCGNCASDAGEACTTDCAGVWGGALRLDGCEVCGGDGSSCEPETHAWLPPWLHCLGGLAAAVAAIWVQLSKVCALTVRARGFSQRTVQL